MTASRRIAAATKSKLADAFALVAREHPQLYSEHLSRAREIGRLNAEKRVLQAETMYLQAKLANRRHK